MTGVQVDSSLFEDKRFNRLAIAAGSMERALGALVLAWLAGKREWSKTGLGMKPEEWEKLELHNEIAAAGLAGVQVESSRVLMKGAKERFGKQGGKKQTKVVAVSVSSTTWEAYSEAYEQRWRKPPVRNAMVNAQVKSLVGRLGAQTAPHVAAFYLKHNDAFYVRALHPVSLLLRDAEKLATEWQRNQTMTGTRAREIERIDNTTDVFDQAFERLKEKPHGRPR